MNSNYVDILIGEYLRRKANNQRYSERAFAASLGLSPGFLKLLFQGKKQLGFERAKEVATKLNWTESKKLSFLKEFNAKSSLTLRGKHIVDEAHFFEVSDWFHFAIVEFIRNHKKSATTEMICRHLGISKTEADYSIKNLLRLKILKQVSENYLEAVDSYEVPSTSSQGIRKYHRQILGKASQAIDKQTVDERDFRGLTISFKKLDLPQAKKDIQKFVADFEKKYGPSAADSVYHLNVSFFRMDKGENP